MDVAAIRAQFPILSREVHGQPLVYLDNAATTQKPQSVIDALSGYYSTMNANIHRGLHTLAEEATSAYEGVRRQVAEFVGASSHREIVFTRNTTESLNLLAYTLGTRLRPGDEIVLSAAEHHSNLVPWQLVTQRTGAVLRFIELNDDQQIDVDTARAAINANTRIVSIVHMSNVLGSIAPVAEIAEMARSVGATMIVDAAQSAPHIPVDVNALGADFVAFSAHKMLGPTGVGVLWGRQELLADLDPFLGGGEMISVVTREESSWAALPHKFEAGTPNIADVIAFGAALDFLHEVGMDAVAAHDAELTHYAVEQLSRLEGLDIYGPADPVDRSAVIAFNYRDIHSHDIATILDRSGIAVRAGHHCAQPLMRTLGVPATARASFYLYNERSEVDALVDGLLEAGERFGFERGA
ncbi:MAG: cysteine desulfurase [Chloroflexi bacterium]|nr:cysteine desulfurase [Chloroflexota bacterium]MCY3696296.1 cysteine desulfurase [Chloroflexota bacterium]MXX32979.1 cysteine desulfurase [Chloroflexota bacterium]MXX79978.1 cysteine desulfurase [Chloroflexota bacterium]MYD16852.1 cysteine desulfurase [Chloroflexota bacterium]